MTLQDFINALQLWLIDEENYFVTKLHSFTNNLNKLIDSSQSSLDLDQTIQEWLVDKQNFNHACTLLMLAYTKQLTQHTLNYHTRLSNGFDAQPFQTWDIPYIKKVSLLNAYATHFLSKLLTTSSTNLTFSDQDLQLTVNLQSGDLNG